MSEKLVRYIWEERERAAVGRARHGTAISDHLDMTAEPYFVAVRELLESWIANYPADRRPEMASRLRSRNDDQFDSAFWELYLHEAYTRAGYSIKVEVSVPGTTRSPDFLIEGGNEPFYLEATSTRRATSTVSDDNRLATIQEALRSATIDAPFRVAVQHQLIGDTSPSTKALLSFLRHWFTTLNYEQVLAMYSKEGIVGLPRRIWQQDGWLLEFIAFPDAASLKGGVMAMWGPSEPSELNYHVAILEAARKKAKAYGSLGAPLVLALQINTEYHAGDHHIERALYGLHLPHPPDGIPVSDTLQESGEGLWVGPDGYRRSHVPEVITASNLHIGFLTTQPRVWPHPDASVHLMQHPDLFASVELGPARVQIATPPDLYFGFDPILNVSSGA